MAHALHIEGFSTAVTESLIVDTCDKYIMYVQIERVIRR